MRRDRKPGQDEKKNVFTNSLIPVARPLRTTLIPHEGLGVRPLLPAEFRVFRFLSRPASPLALSLRHPLRIRGFQSESRGGNTRRTVPRKHGRIKSIRGQEGNT